MRNLILFICLTISLNINSQTIEQVWQEINCNELKHPEIVLAQSIKEAGWHYDSYNAIKRNNLFGIKGGKKCSSNKYGYKIFNHWSESVVDYKNRIQNRYLEDENYYNFLIRIGYFETEASKYINDLKWIINKLKRDYGI